MRRKFLRRSTGEKLKFGKKRKKKQIWRKARGRDNKIREKRAGRPRKPEIGMKKDKKFRGKVLGMVPIMVSKIEELKEIKTGQIVILAKLGKRKKEVLLKEAEKMNLRVLVSEISKKDKWRKKK